MNQPDEPRIEPDLIESLKRYQLPEGRVAMALINMAVKEFIISMDDDLETSGIPNPEMVDIR